MPSSRRREPRLIAVTRPSNGGSVVAGSAPLLDQQDRDAGAGQRARQRQAGHAAARDQHIEARFAIRHRPTVPQPRQRLQGRVDRSASR